MQTDEIGISVKDCRVSKLLSNTAGCPAKKFDEKASKFYGYETRPSEHIWDMTKRKWGDVTTHDVMKCNKRCIQ